MRYSLRQLQVFIETAHYENISKAANSLAMSQSAASTALKELEKQFDVQLFDRIGKRLQLNSLGKALRPQAEHLLAKANEFEQALLQQKNFGAVRLGATQTIGGYLAVDLINDFQQEFISAEVSLNVANTQHIVEQLLSFEIDVALVEGEVNHPSLHVLPWRKDELCVFCAPENTYASFKELKDKALLNADWIVREKGSGTRQAFERAMSGIFPGMNIKMELEHSEAIKRAVAANMGVSCLSRLALEVELESGKLIQLKTKDRNLQRQLYLVWHQDKYLSESLKQFLKHCQQYQF